VRISLRGRLALWFLLTVPFIVFVLVFTAQHIMVSNMRGDLDADLQARTQTFAKALISNAGNSQEDYTDMTIRFVDQQSGSIPLLLRLSNAQGSIPPLATFGQVPAALMPGLNSQLNQTDIGEGRFHTVKAKGTASLRVYTAPVKGPVNGETLFRIQTGDDFAPIKAAESRLWHYTIIEGIAGTLVVLLAGLLILRQGLRPLDRILSGVRKMETSNLGTGIPKEPRPPELQRLADSLNTMWQQLEATFKARETFVASVSHDLRTPLTALQGQIEVLLMQTSLDSQIKDSLQRMSREVHRLVRMTNNLLLNAQLESNSTHITDAVNIRELLSEIVNEVQPLTAGLDLRLSAPEEVAVSGDYDLLKQTVLNVVDNSIKFTPKGGQIDIVLGRDEDWAVIQVSDSGQGISKEDLPHVTEPFYKKAGDIRRSGSGAGLGLAIVKQVVDLHGGQLEIQSEERVGTTVKIRLPALLPVDPSEAD
jgi:two-component system OmpR family sensor kinase